MLLFIDHFWPQNWFFKKYTSFKPYVAMTQHLGSKIANEVVTQKSPQKKQRSLRFVTYGSNQFQRGWEGLCNPVLVLIFPWASSKPSLQLSFWQTEVSCQTRLPLPNRSQIGSLCPLFRSEITPCWLIQLSAWHISTLQSNFPGMQAPERTRTQRKRPQLRRKQEP